MVRLLVKGGISVDMNKYKELVDRINIIEKNLLAHEERERELINLIGITRKYKDFYNDGISINDIIELIPFDIFDLYINNKFIMRGLHKYDINRENLCAKKVMDVRISCIGNIVDIITA